MAFSNATASYILKVFVRSFFCLVALASVEAASAPTPAPLGKPAYIVISTNDSDSPFGDTKQNVLIQENHKGIVSEIATKLLESNPQKCLIYLWSVYPVAILDKHKSVIAAFYYNPMAKPGPVFIRMKVLKFDGTVKMIPTGDAGSKGIVFDGFDALVKPWIQIK